MEHTLNITFGTSRGRETYGYGVVTLRERGEIKAQTKGGGYDMRGTVFADWLQEAYQDRLVAIAPRMEAQRGDGRYLTSKAPGSLYGGTYHLDRANGTENGPVVTLDGGCGFRSIQLIAEAIGLKVRMIDAGKKQDVILVTDGQVAA